MPAAAFANLHAGLTNAQKQNRLQVLGAVPLYALGVPGIVAFTHGESARGASLYLGALVSWYLFKDMLPAAMGLKAERRWFVMCAYVPLVLLSIVAWYLLNTKDTGSSDANDYANFDRGVAAAVCGWVAWHMGKDCLPAILDIPG